MSNNLTANTALGQRIVQHMMATRNLTLADIENRLVRDFAAGNVPDEYHDRAWLVLDTVRTMRAGEEIH